jgi:hypothetical protein
MGLNMAPVAMETREQGRAMLAFVFVFGANAMHQKLDFQSFFCESYLDRIATCFLGI